MFVTVNLEAKRTQRQKGVDTVYHEAHLASRTRNL